MAEAGAKVAVTVKLSEVPEAQQAWMRLRKVRSLALVRGQEHASRDELESVQAPLRDRGFSGQSSIDIADMMHGIGIALKAGRADGVGQMGDRAGNSRGARPTQGARSLRTQHSLDPANAGLRRMHDPVRRSSPSFRAGLVRA